MVNYILYAMSCHYEANPHPNICTLQSSERRIAGSVCSNKSNKNITYARCELDSHADTTVAGSNCIILHYTGKECDVSPYRDNYNPIQNVPIVTAATAWQSPVTGQTYILVLNEALWMGDTMQHTLLNPNQLRHFGTMVQDNPMSNHPLSIITEDYDFSMGLTMVGTIVYTDTHTPSQNELASCPHVQLTSPKPWDPHTVRFPKPTLSLEDVMVNN